MCVAGILGCTSTGRLCECVRSGWLNITCACGGGGHYKNLTQFGRQAIKRKAKLAEARENQARIKAKMEEIESRVASKLAHEKEKAAPQKGGWGFGWN
jgi:hypothetical protein